MSWKFQKSRRPHKFPKVPEFLEVQEVPEVPEIPIKKNLKSRVPNVPEVPEVQEVPEIPEFLEIPEAAFTVQWRKAQCHVGNAVPVPTSVNTAALLPGFKGHVTSSRKSMTTSRTAQCQRIRTLAM